MNNLITMGVDIGQKREPTAICVTEIDERRIGRRLVNHWVVRHLERLPIGTSYPAVAQRLSEVSGGIRQKATRRPYLYVDATGIGQPIIDLLRDETTRLGQITPVYFSHGDQRSHEGGEIRLGKAYLVSRLQMLLQTARLHLPRTTESERAGPGATRLRDPGRREGQRALRSLSRRFARRPRHRPGPGGKQGASAALRLLIPRW